MRTGRARGSARMKTGPRSRFPFPDPVTSFPEPVEPIAMYETHGDLRAFVKTSLKPSDTGIEIGGGFNPLVMKKEGYNIFTVDHLTKDELIEKYKNDPSVKHLLRNIQDVDGVEDGREFRELLGLESGVDYMVSIHNFEHIPNPVRFLQRCENALKEDGRLYLIIPDRRGTFDYFRPVSSFGQWMEAYKDNHTVHTYAAFYDMLAYPVDGNGDYGTVNLLRAPEAVHKSAQTDYTPDAYIDVHGFVYTPSSFAFLLSYAQQIGLTSLGIEKIVVRPDSHFEFLAVLRKNAGTEVSLKEYAIRMGGENINYRRSFHQPAAPAPAQPAVPLRRQVFERFRASHPVAAKVLHPFAKALWRMYKRFG